MPSQLCNAIFILSLVACSIEIDISVPGFPALSDEFGISDALTQGTITINFLGFLLSSLIVGPFAERYGRRIVMLIGNAVMLFGAIFCTVSSSIEMLLLARFIQGLGASTSAVVVFVMIADLYKGPIAEKLIGLMNAVLTTLMAFAPVMGAYLVAAIGWRGNYGFVAMITLIAWSLMLWRLPETRSKDSRPQQNILRQYVLFMKSGRFQLFSMLPSLLYASYLSFIACAPFFYMESHNISLEEYALHQTAAVGSFAVLSLFAAQIINLLGRRKTIYMATFCIAFGGILILIGDHYFLHAYWIVTISMMIYCVGFALFYPIVFTLSLAVFPELKGVASSLIMAIRALLCAGLVAFTSILFDGSVVGVSYLIVSIAGVLVLTLKSIIREVR